MKQSTLSADDLRLLEERLPWYVNGTLDASARAWVEDVLARSQDAVELLECEQALSHAVPSMMAPAAPDIGLEQLLARVHADRQQQQQLQRQASAAAAPAAGLRRAIETLLHWLTRPQLATAMALALVVQTGVVGWLVSASGPGDITAHRSAGVTEVRTLRITFVPSASEAQIRAALLNAGARIVGGPTQLGEYWVASGMVSLDEIKASLMKSGLVASMEVDLTGPRGQ